MATERERLAPCPFCGGEPLIGQTLDGAWYAMCAKDFCAKLETYWRTEDEAITAWNTRTQQPDTVPSDDEGREVVEAIVKRECSNPHCSCHEQAALNATQPTEAEVREVVEFSDPILGHWETADGTEMANRCLGETREQLSMSHLSDMTLANHQYLVSRESLDLIHYRTAAKERIRWLSAQLARANILLERLSPAAAVRREEG